MVNTFPGTILIPIYRFESCIRNTGGHEVWSKSGMTRCELELFLNN